LAFAIYSQPAISRRSKPRQENAMKRNPFLFAALSLALIGGTAALSGTAASAQQYGPPPPPRYQQQGGWDAPPPEFAAAQQRGFHDGIEGAKKDFENHRPPNVTNRDEYRNPSFVAPPDRRSYREGFRRGYDVGVRHIYPGRHPY
jgi:hypothetical protein